MPNSVTGAGAEALHGEREVGQPAVVGERLAREAERAHVELGAQAQEAGLGQAPHERAAGRIDVVLGVGELAEPGPKASSSSFSAR